MPLQEVMRGDQGRAFRSHFTAQCFLHHDTPCGLIARPKDCNQPEFGESNLVPDDNYHPERSTSDPVVTELLNLDH
jgi:hypothetical protein